MYCWGQYPWVFLVSLAVTLDSAETPFAKTPFSWFLILALSLVWFAGATPEFFGHTKQRLKNIRGKYRSIFREKILKCAHASHEVQTVN